MNTSSGELVLNIQSHKSNENPYSYISIPPPKQIEKDSQQNHSNNYFFYILSVILISLFYTLCMRVKSGFLEIKLYHSLSLGIIVLFEFVFNKQQFNIHSDESFDKGENLIIKEDYIRYMSNKDYYVVSITYGIIVFIIELFSIYLLKLTVMMDYNISIGFSLLALEYLFIRAHQSFNMNNDISTLIGVVSTFFIFIFVNIFYFDFKLNILILSIILSILKFFKFYFSNHLNMKFKKYSIDKSIIGLNIIDFLIGLIILIHFLIDVRRFHLDFSSSFIIFLASICYYLNFKFFNNYLITDKIKYIISSLIFPTIMIFDMLINHKKIHLVPLLISIVLTVSVSLVFSGHRKNK